MRVVAAGFKRESINNTGLYFFCDREKIKDKALKKLGHQWFNTKAM